MIEYRTADLLEEPDLTHLIHQCNLFCTFGSGLAASIKKRYPEAYAADCATKKGDTRKLGKWSEALVADGKIVINLYAQLGIDSKHRTTSYDLMCKGLTDLEKVLAKNPTQVVLGIPYKMGCGLAGGSWRIVENIIIDVFENSNVHIVICQRPQDLC